MKLNHQKQTEFISFYRFCKRATDITGAILGIILFSPAFLILPILVKLDSKGPVIHKHRVSGKDNILFYFYKFRTMIDSADEVVEEWRKKDFKLYQEYMSNIKLEKDLRANDLDILPEKGEQLGMKIDSECINNWLRRIDVKILMKGAFVILVGRNYGVYWARYHPC